MIEARLLVAASEIIFHHTWTRSEHCRSVNGSARQVEAVRSGMLDAYADNLNA
jgi:hypothetical protein